MFQGPSPETLRHRGEEQPTEEPARSGAQQDARPERHDVTGGDGHRRGQSEADYHPPEREDRLKARKKDHRPDTSRINRLFHVLTLG